MHDQLGVTAGLLGAGGNVVGGVAARAVEGQSAQQIFSPKAEAVDAVSGFAGGAVGGAKIREKLGESIAYGSAEVAAASGDQASTSFYVNNANRIGNGIAKGIDLAQGAAESYHDAANEHNDQQSTSQQPRQPPPPPPDKVSHLF